ncbi:MAG: hypothetical protein Q7K45_04640, partial [Nanoarchaeota archaeon]|nr:hypothetical protein [Nanoarchaeota archaeon]
DADICVEEEDELIADNGVLTSMGLHRPQLHNTTWVDNFQPYKEMKIYGFNGLHAICGFLGYALGYEHIHDAMSDGWIREKVHAAGQAVGAAITEKHRINPKIVDRYIGDILRRFENQISRDTVERVTRHPMRKLMPEERLVGGLNLCKEFSLRQQYLSWKGNHGVDAFAYGIAAAMMFNNPKDEVALRLSERIKGHGLKDGLSTICKIDDPAMHDFIRRKIAGISLHRKGILVASLFGAQAKRGDYQDLTERMQNSAGVDRVQYDFVQIPGGEDNVSDLGFHRQIFREAKYGHDLWIPREAHLILDKNVLLDSPETLLEFVKGHLQEMDIIVVPANIFSSGEELERMLKDIRKESFYPGCAI